MTDTKPYTETISTIIFAAILPENAKPRVNLRLIEVPNYYADVKDGRAPRNLPLTGSHEMYKLADQLDRDAARLVTVFTVAGTINGVDFDKVTIWINGTDVSLPTLYTGTEKARTLLYMLGRTVAEKIVAIPAILDDAWQEHLRGLDARLDERAAFIAAVRAELAAQLTTSAV